MTLAIDLKVDGSASPEALRSLAGFLRGETELRGRIAITTSPPAIGEMGAVLDVIEASVASGGAVAVLCASVTTWLRTRVGSVHVHIESPSNAVDVTADNVRGLDAAALSTLVDKLSGRLEP